MTSFAGDANANLPRLARLAEVWEKIVRAARDTESYNLERKPLVFSVFGMLAGRYSSPEEVYAGFGRIEQLGVGYHNPHQWYVDYEPDETRAFAATTDPTGILNPGKLDVAPAVDTGSQL